MPKVSHRCKRRSQFSNNFVPVTLTGFANAPRKVSFEDGHHEGHNESDSDSSHKPILMTITDTPAPLSRKSTLVRPKSSMSLVDLAKKMDKESRQPARRERSYSVPVTPVLSPVPIETPFSAPSAPSSPWGQFVEMSAPEEDDPCRGATHQYHEPICNCCTSCRRRRCSPYGEYGRGKKCPKAPQPGASWSVPSSFRLSPRKRVPADDQLIGALHKLQVD